MQPSPYSKTSGLNLDITRFFDSIVRCFKNISFGLNGQTDNIAGAVINVLTPVTPNTEFEVDHNLGIIPSGFLVINKTAAVDLYASGTPWDETAIYLCATVRAVGVTIFVLG
jgi:hypothetical protein